MVNVIILAGGFGTRLKKTISDVPKPMAPVNGKPFLYYLLSHLRTQKITHFYISVHHMAKKIHDYFGDSFEGIPISYSYEKEALGTGGAILHTLNTYEKLKKSAFFVVNGDTWFPINLDNLIKSHNEGITCTLALTHYINTKRYGNVTINSEGIIESLKEKEAHDEGLINGGVYLFSPSAFNYKSLKPTSLEKDILPDLILEKSIKGVVYDVTFLDIGTPEDYKQASSVLTHHLIKV